MTDTPAFAVVNGTPLHDLPDDLYIPPDALKVLLETFAGPLDLLLYLIRKQNIDILNIPIATITTQYIRYIQVMDELNIELAAEYLVMAAMLAEIKSRLLLPRPPSVDSEEDDPRATLIRRLQDYEAIKIAAEELDALPRLERDIFLTQVNASLELAPMFPDVALADVLSAFRDVLKRAHQLSHHAIKREPLSVRERMSAILQTLNGVSDCTFSQLFSHAEGRAGVVVSFLAVLELSKERLIVLEQHEPYCEIRLRRA